MGLELVCPVCGGLVEADDEEALVGRLATSDLKRIDARHLTTDQHGNRNPVVGSRR